MACSTALLLLLVVAATTAQLQEIEPLVDVEPASSTTSAELGLHLAALQATIAEFYEKGPHVVEAASPTAELEPEPEPEPDDVEPARRRYVIELELPAGGGQHADADAARAWNLTFLPSATTLLYSYRKVFTGFAARLTEELKEVSAKPGFLRYYNETIYTAQTTHTPTSASFVDLPNRFGDSPDNWPGAGG